MKSWARQKVSTWPIIIYGLKLTDCVSGFTVNCVKRHGAITFVVGNSSEFVAVSGTEFLACPREKTESNTGNKKSEWKTTLALYLVPLRNS
jgi:hypothetical protein